MPAPPPTGGAPSRGASPVPKPIQTHRTVVGLGVPPLPSRLDLDEDANATVHDRRTPIVAMPAFFDRPTMPADAPPSPAALDPIASAPRPGELIHSAPDFPDSPHTPP